MLEVCTPEIQEYFDGFEDVHCTALRSNAIIYTAVPQPLPQFYQFFRQTLTVMLKIS